MQSPTTPSPFLVTLSLPALTVSSERRRSRRGAPRPVSPPNAGRGAPHRGHTPQRDKALRPGPERWRAGAQGRGRVHPYPPSPAVYGPSPSCPQHSPEDPALGSLHTLAVDHGGTGWRLAPNPLTICRD